jgi:hypothetical protein
VENNGVPFTLWCYGWYNSLDQDAQRAPCVRALYGSRFIRKMAGSSQAHLVEGSDANFYVVKFLSNPQQRRTLINEWVGSAMLRYLGISSPAAELIYIDQDFLAENQGVYLDTRTGRKQPAVGLHFASRFPGDPGRMAVYDFLPDALLERVENSNDFLGALVFDKWTSNVDARQAIFFRGASAGRYVVQMVDQGAIFGGSDWSFGDSPIRGVYFRPSVYGGIRNLSHFDPWLRLVKTFSVSVLEDVVKRVPPAWLADDESLLRRLVDRLLQRRDRLPDLIQEFFQVLSNSS